MCLSDFLARDCCALSTKNGRIIWLGKKMLTTRSMAAIIKETNDADTGRFDYYTFRAFSCERKDGSLNQINSVFVIGESRTNSDNAITKNYGTFYMAFEVDDLTSEVLDFSCTHTISTTEAFLRKLFVGQVFPEIDVWLENTLNRRYGGSSRRAVLVAYRDALKRWRSMTGKPESET